MNTIVDPLIAELDQLRSSILEDRIACAGTPNSPALPASAAVTVRTAMCMLDRMRTALNDANSICRSTHQILSRENLSMTDVEAFRERLMESLILQHKVMNPDQYPDASVASKVDPSPSMEEQFSARLSSIDGMLSTLAKKLESLGEQLPKRRNSIG